MFRSYIRIFSYLKPYTLKIIGSFICTLLLIAIVIYIPSITGYLVDDVLKTRDIRLLTHLILAGIGLLLLKGVISYFQVYLMVFAGEGAVRDLRQEFFSHLTRLSFSFFTKWHTGDLISRAIADIAIIRETFVMNFVRVIPQIFIFLGLLIRIFILNLHLALASCLIIPIILVLLVKFGKRVKSVSKTLQGKVDNLSSLINEVISGIRTVKSFCREDYEKDRFRNINQENFSVGVFRSKLRAIQDASVEFIAVLGFFAVVLIAGLQLIKGKITPGELTAFFTALVLIAEPISTISRSYFHWQETAASSDRIFQIIDTKEKVEEKPMASDMPRIRGEVEFRDISFSYDGRKEILKGICIKVEEGETIGLVGKSGAGKTTLLSLIPRFYDPTNGVILIDGRDIGDFKIRTLREQIGILLQEPILFSGTIRENILYGRLDATQEEIIKASQLANIHSFIESLPNGYDTEIGERGVKLSGGERQRIAIARVLIKSPRIILLDEPTSAIDAESEELIHEAIKNLMKGRTTFIIAHRLSTVKHVDRLVVIDNGEVAEIGKHSELLEKEGIYADLFKSQLFM
ncbi:MAG: ABC transporter ATP-binding protein [bacterium]|nr:ABC transporter ATP-binding protein [bacterium]